MPNLVLWNDLVSTFAFSFLTMNHDMISVENCEVKVPCNMATFSIQTHIFPHHTLLHVSDFQPKITTETSQFLHRTHLTYILQLFGEHPREAKKAGIFRFFRLLGA